MIAAQNRRNVTFHGGLALFGLGQIAQLQCGGHCRNANFTIEACEERAGILRASGRMLLKGIGIFNVGHGFNSTRGTDICILADVG